MNNLRILNRVMLPALLFLLGLVWMVPVLSSDWVHVRLKDRLDRPVDGYCLDILGNQNNLRVDLPLFAHNCKSGPTADSVVVFTSSGLLVFPAAEVCVTAFGVNRTVLPGTSVLLRPCNEQTPFFNADALQKFEYLDNGQFQLSGYDLCLSVGNEASRTYSANDRWPVLSLEACNSVPLDRSARDLVPL